jgi:glutathione S-transferase
MIELYDALLNNQPISGNGHKVRLMLSLLGLEFRSHWLNLGEREQKSPAYLALNPFGQVPVLKDGDIVLRDSQAILVYLARAYGGDQWFPENPVKAALVTAWLSVASNEIVRGPAPLRAHHKLGRPINLDEAQTLTASLLDILNQQLAEQAWLATDQITIADVAIYPYIALANEGRVELDTYPHILRWMAAIEQLDGYVPMPGMQRVANAA